MRTFGLLSAFGSALSMVIGTFFVVSCAKEQDPSCTGEVFEGTIRSTASAGFTSAYFSESILLSMAAQPGFDHFRFYNARRSAGDVSGTVIAIGVRSDGSEIYNGTTFKYRMYDALSGSAASTLSKTQGQSKDGINHLKVAGGRSIAIEVSKNTVTNMLNAPQCNGIKLVPEWLASADGWSMRVGPVQIAASSGSALPSPASYLAGDPCPTLCGNNEMFYLHL